jgi:hypothetical protein
VMFGTEHLQNKGEKPRSFKRRMKALSPGGDAVPPFARRKCIGNAGGKEVTIPYQPTDTAWVVHLVRLRGLPDDAMAQWRRLRPEAGRRWTELVQMPAAARVQGQWLQAGDLEKATQGGQ